MNMPSFKTSVYTSLICGIGAFFSPFGWGSQIPLPEMNFIISSLCYIMAFVAGIHTLVSWIKHKYFLKNYFVILSLASCIFFVWNGYQSFWLQGTTIHYQRFTHMRIILFQLVVLGVVVIMKTVEDRISFKKSQDLPPQKGGNMQPSVSPNPPPSGPVD